MNSDKVTINETKTTMAARIAGNRHIADLLEPIRVINNHACLGRAPVLGRLVAIECYRDEPLAGLFHADGGGTFHDLPLGSFAPASEVGSFDPAGIWLDRYAMPDEGRPVVEAGALAGQVVSLFGGGGCRVGSGVVRCAIHWPAGNKLLHVVTAGGAVVLVPPHKLMVGDRASLPVWTKLKAGS